MKRRIFIAVNLPEKVKDKLVEFQDKYDYLPVRWTREESLHLTLTFIGYVDNEEMLEICKIARELAAKIEQFYISFKRIVLGPPGKPPRMIWVEGEPSLALAELKKKLENLLIAGETGFLESEKRPFSPHITLGRIKMEQWPARQRPEPQAMAGGRQLPEKPAIDESFDFQIPVNSIDVMESNLKRSGAEYTILEECLLK